ncbi:unnamed protein product [Rhodiola kirilowii]
MASSAFKSTSKRGCDASKPTTGRRGNATDLTKKCTGSRRSRSVSAVNRTDLHFSNKRDNPLFSRHDSPPPDYTGNSEEVRIGRSYSENVDLTDESGRSRSSSSVVTGRRFRSLSRKPSPRSRNAHESETEKEYDSFSDCNKQQLLSNLVRNSGDAVNLMKTPKTWSTVHPLSEPSDSSPSMCSRVPNWEDRGSGFYFSEAEEQTINEFNQHILYMEDDHDEVDSTIHETGGPEVRRSICDIQNDLVDRGTNPTMASVNVPHSAQSPSPVELVLDIRREYVKELEQSEERARKLRADLAAEEHRGMELGRVLKELLPDSRVASLQRCGRARKNSIERRRMSDRLTDEALAYFDECISISTFDSSDLSSQEDPPLNLQASTAVQSSKSVTRGCSTIRVVSSNDTVPSCYQERSGDDTYNQDNPSISASNNSIVQPGLSSTFISKGSNSRGKLYRFQEDMKNYTTNRDIEKHACYSQSLGRELDIDAYNLHGKAENILFDKVVFQNRIDSGSVHLCGGAAFSVYPFSFIF